jgi:putative membrane-bound dehydrogenase-like protein
MRARSMAAAAGAFALVAVANAASPLSPADEIKSFQLADSNLVVELVAAEPDVRAPVAIAWDADGRMFVAEMTDYPSGPVNGRIRVLEDRDGDGRYERSTIFATNLAFPNGVMAWKNGVLVTAAPDIWFLADTNGDGAADVREKILTGFAEGNQQLRVNGLFWGIDNWIYGANGRSDGEVKWADGTPAGSIRRHDFRFRPDTKQFEVIAGNSQFGMGHDDWGNRFPVFNNTPIRHVVIEDKYLARQSLLAGTDNVPGISPTNDGNRVFALTPPTLLIPQPVGFFTSACGPSIFRGTALPESYRGNYFVCEPVQNVVQRRVLKPNGSTFIAEYAHTNKEFLASTDRWFHGVFTTTGPDGAFYIVDFYRDLVEHPHWVAPEIRDKVDWRKGEEHGRIWKVRAKDAKVVKVEKLSRASNTEFVRSLESADGWTRDTAQRLLIERDARDVVAFLDEDAIKGQSPQTQVHALNVLDALHGSGPHQSPSNDSRAFAKQRSVGAIILAALKDANPRVREHGVRLAEKRLITDDRAGAEILASLSRLTADADARVRLQVACTLGTSVDDEARWDGLARLTKPENLDEWQTTAILMSAGRPWKIVSRLIASGAPLTHVQLTFLERAARAVAAGDNREDKQELIAWVSTWKPIERVAVAAAFAEGLGSKERLDVIVPKGLLSSIKASALDAAHDHSEPLHVRTAATRLIEPAELASLVSAAEPESLQGAAGRALMESGDGASIRAVLGRWNDLPKSVRRQLVGFSTRSKVAALELERAVDENKVPLLEVDPTTRQVLEKFNDPEVKSRAVKLFAGAVSPDREAAVQKYHPALKLAGERKHGAVIFERTCAVCHQMQGVGARVGPDLSGIGQQARETLLVQILDPSRQVLPDFVAYNATTSGGETYTGFIAGESATTVTLRRANEPDITLPRAELKEFSTSGKSLMPDGLEAEMTEQDMADLIEFLRRPDRTLFTQSK